jgi:hypothetical protein
MLFYNPTINRQVVSSSEAGNNTATYHARELCAYGPAPRNYYIEPKYNPRLCVLYADHSIDNTVRTTSKGASYNHPLSPEGLKKSPNPNILLEFTDTRPGFPGFF